MAEEKELIQEVLTRFDYLKKRREVWDKRWELISEYVLPRISDFDNETRSAPDKKQRGRVYDTTAISTLRLASDGTQGYMTPRSSPWYRLAFENRQIERDPQARKFLQEAEEILYAAFARSNFYDQLGQCYDTGFSIGTTSIGVDYDEDAEKMVYETLHTKEVYIAEDRFHQVDTHFREEWFTGKQLIETFGSEVLPKEMLERIAQKPYEDHKVVHAIFPRSDRIAGRIDAKNKPWASVYILVKPRTLLRESGLDDFNYAVWRFRTNPQEEYGSSPSWDALVDVLRTNEVGRTLLQAGQLAVEPPLWFPEELRNQIDITPRGGIGYRDPARPVKALDVFGSYPIGRDQEEALQESIRQHFRVDFYLMLSQADRTKTATEVVEIAGEKAALMGTMIGRIESELLDPLIGITFRKLFRAGKLPPLPPILQDRPDEAVKINYVGPLAQLQKRHHGQQSVTQMLAQVAPIIQLFPEARDHINADEMMRKTMEKNGADQEFIREVREVEQLRALRARARQRERQMQYAEQMSKLLPHLKQHGGNPMQQTADRAGRGLREVSEHE